MSATVYFDELEVGMQWQSPRRTITEADISAFAGVSGDFNPLHVDALAAAAGGYGGRIAHGALVFSVATGLRQQMGVFTESHRGLLEITSWKFVTPVKPGDTVDALTTIKELRPTSKGGRGVVIQAVDVRNQRGEIVQSGDLVTLIATREPVATA